jgi:hypothetical protein
MKRLAVLLLLAGCGSQDKVGESGDGAEIVPPAPAAENLSAGSPAADAARLQARVESAMAVILPDPAKARYAEVRAGAAGSVCGTVDPGERTARAGGFRPFVVTPEGVAIVSPTPAISFGDPSDIFPDFYIRWCATPEELARLAPELRGTIEAPPPADPGAVDDFLPDLLEPPPPEPPRPPEGRPAEEDSFSKAVRRKSDAPPAD